MTKSRKLLIATGAVAGLCLLGYILARIGVMIVSPPPDNLGVSNRQLAPCPQTPNCVSSRANDAQHAIDPLVYSDSRDAAHARLEQVLENMPRLTLVENRPDYIRAETRTLIWGFIDDNEFYFDDDVKTIEVRAAARLGHSDLGKNRERIEHIRTQFETANP